MPKKQTAPKAKPKLKPQPKKEPESGIDLKINALTERYDKPESSQGSPASLSILIGLKQIRLLEEIRGLLCTKREPT